MVTNLGYLLMVAALGVSAYGIIAPHLGARRNNWNLIRSAQYGAALNLLLVTVLFLSSDISILHAM